MRGKIPTALTIAGSDSGGGAGIQADLRTFHQFGVYGTCAISLITAQNSLRFSRLELVDPSLVKDQIDVVLEDFPPQAVKTGALGSVEIITIISNSELRCPLVVDPVMISTSGSALLSPNALTALRELLLPRAALVTPNLYESEQLSGMEVDTVQRMREAAIRIKKYGSEAVLIKGGHLRGDAVDVLFQDGRFTEFRSPHLETQHTHGTGCTYSAAITALLAHGRTLEDSVRAAKAFVTEAIRTAPGLGGGEGPLNHWTTI